MHELEALDADAIEQAFRIVPYPGNRHPGKRNLLLFEEGLELQVGGMELVLVAADQTDEDSLAQLGGIALNEGVVAELCRQLRHPSRPPRRFAPQRDRSRQDHPRETRERRHVGLAPRPPGEAEKENHRHAGGRFATELAVIRRYRCHAGPVSQ